MIDYHAQFVSALKPILPIHYEMALTAKTTTPCFSYMELNNRVTSHGETLGYSRITFQLKVWGNDIAVIQQKALEADAALRPLGWVRISSGELYDNQSTMMQKILTYEALAVEDY